MLTDYKILFLCPVDERASKSFKRHSVGNITLSVPEDMHREMKKFSEVKWSEVARKAFTEKLEALRLAERLAKKAS